MGWYQAQTDRGTEGQVERKKREGEKLEGKTG